MAETLPERLRALGYDVDDLLDLPRSGRRYPDAVPVLAAALASEGDSAVREHIVRALAVPWASAALPAVLAEFAREPVPGDDGEELTRWAAGNTVDVIWEDREFDVICALARQTRFGAARQMLVHGLRRSQHPDAEALAVELLADPGVAGHAAIALGAIGTERCLQALSELIRSGPAWQRKQATRAATLVMRRSTRSRSCGGAHGPPHSGTQ